MKLKMIVLTMCLIIMAAYNAHAQTQTGFRVPARLDIGGGRMTGDMWCQYGTNGVRFIIGTQAVTQVGTAGVMTGTIASGSPSLDISYSGGSTSANFEGFNAVYIAGSQVGTSGALTGKLDAIDGVGTNNTFNNPTLAGLGTITASFGANGLVISPAEYASVNNATGELQSQITTATGSITNHAHSGSDGTTQVSHNNVTGTGTNSHTTIDTFIASKASASGVASLDANSLVVQNPASGTSTPGINKTVMSDGTSKISDNWLSNNITKLGTPTTDNISEGSTNKYHTDARVNAAIGSLSVNVLNDTNINMANENDFVKIVGGQLVAGSSSVTVAFSEVTGSASASQLPLISGLLGSATSAQLPLVVKLYGTTTEQAAGNYGQFYVQSSSGVSSASSDAYTSDAYTKLLLHMNNPGTSTFVDSSGSAHTITAVAGAIGTSTAKFNSGSGYFDGIGDLLSIPDSDDFSFGTGDFTIEFWTRLKVDVGGEYFTGQLTGAGTDEWFIRRQGASVQASIKGSVLKSVVATTSLVINTWYHIAFIRNGNNLNLYINGTAEGGTTDVTGQTMVDPSSSVLKINGVGDYAPSDGVLNGYIDEFRISKGIARWTSNFTPPTASYDLYTQYSAKYKDPINGNTVLEILTHGTVTTEASYIYNNATTTVWGLGTNTAVTGTTSGAYAGWTNRPIRVLAVDIGSSKEIKDNIKTIKIKPDLLDAEGLAKQNYIAGAKVAWMAANQANYTSVVNETGTGSVSVIDTSAMESDYNNYIELEWASDMNQDLYTENIQKTYEKGFWQMYNSVTPKSWNPIVNPLATYEGFIVEEMPDVVKGDDGQSINIMSIVAYMSVVQQSLKADTIFALSTLKELLTTGTVTQQKIDYVNDRLEVLNP